MFKDTLILIFIMFVIVMLALACLFSLRPGAMAGFAFALLCVGGLLTFFLYGEGHQPGELYGDYLRRLFPEAIALLRTFWSDMKAQAWSIVAPTRKEKEKREPPDGAEYDPYERKED